MGKNLVWCQYDESTDDFDEELPICRAEYNGTLIPGRYYSFGSCEVGFNLELHYFHSGQQEFEVLKKGAC